MRVPRVQRSFDRSALHQVSFPQWFAHPRNILLVEAEKWVACQPVGRLLAHVWGLLRAPNRATHATPFAFVGQCVTLLDCLSMVPGGCVLRSFD